MSHPLIFIAKPNFGSHQRQHREVLGWLRRHFDVRLAGDESEALAAIRGLDTPPRAILLAQTHRNQFDQAFVERLHAAAPLARLINLLDAWCEGELRSGQPLAGVLRVYEHQWQARFPHLLRTDPRAAFAGWNSPRSVSSNELMLAEATRPLRTGQGLLGIIASDCVTYESLAALAARGGYSTTWLLPDREPRIRGAVALLWDEPIAEPAGWQRVARWRERLPSLPMVALCSYPRRHERAQLLEAGCASVVSKPFLIHDVWTELTRLTTASHKDSAAEPSAA